MAFIVIRAILFGGLGLLLIPVGTFFAVLMIAYGSGGCGAGDSGGCEMGAASLATASAIPGFAIFFVVTLVRGLGRRRKELSLVARQNELG